MSTVTVLSGGTSDERAVSLRSGDAVCDALQQAGYTVQRYDPAELSSGELEVACRTADVIFPVLHGLGGEDGVLQTWLEARGLRYVGTDAAVSALCFDKLRYKAAITELDIRNPAGELVNKDTVWQSPLASAPYVLKPNDGGSSVDTFIVRNPQAADTTAITDAFTRHPHMLLEELVSGQEITVGIMQDKALPVIEIIPPSDGEFDYDNKYNGKTQELCPPQNVDSTVQAEAARISLYIHQTLELRDFSRTDIMVRGSDKALFVLETNTIPGMTAQSLIPKAAAAAGYSLPDFCRILVEAALQRPA